MLNDQVSINTNMFRNNRNIHIYWYNEQSKTYLTKTMLDVFVKYILHLS